ncbi:PREDICTED: uncharacterized protein LOC104803375 [Tarenaya hassleriana]|uniref:uncharacterized protein LOC104803375 n=1 Tax=Tarenaya hassleriana TaxID=28532 RepID=UPI00053C7C67|nr:PREDICTED: uncharacterized protein LOC104803375 [Tarenaya hassleriana]
MESPLGFMAVFAVSGSVVLLATQFHKRLLSDFMEKIKFELRSQKCMAMKKVRLAADVVGPSVNNEEYRRRHSKGKFGGNLRNKNAMILGNNNKGIHNHNMPLNRQVLYKGIIEYKTNYL